MASELLRPELRRALQRLELRAGKRLAQGSPGLHGARRRGADDDFREHRRYAQGDDLRQVDWRATARTGHILLRSRHGAITHPLVLLLDATGSMDFGLKLRQAQTLAAAIGYLAFRARDPVELFVLGARGFVRVVRILPGPRALNVLLLALAQVKAGGTAEVGVSLGEAVRLAPASSHLVVISDFYGEMSAVADAIRRAVRSGKEATVFQVLADSERRIAPGSRAVVDLESGNQLALDERAIAAHAEAMTGFVAGVKRAMTAAGARYVPASAEVSPLVILEEWLA